MCVFHPYLFASVKGDPNIQLEVLEIKVVKIGIVDVRQLTSSVKYWQPKKLYSCRCGLTINITLQTLRVRRGFEHVNDD